jgi:hypothetical protein
MPGKCLQCKGVPLNNILKAIQYISSTITDGNEFEAYGRSIASQLIMLPLQDALKLQIQTKKMIAQRWLKVLADPEAITQTQPFFLIYKHTEVFSKYHESAASFCAYKGNRAVSDLIRCRQLGEILK